MHKAHKQAVLCKWNLNTPTYNVLAIYRALTGDFELFLNKLESIIDYLYTPTAEFAICGNMNINYLTESYYKQCLNSLLASFNLMSIANFPTRIQNYSSTATDNVFIDSSRKEHISIEPVINGLSDHDAQLLVIKNIESISNYHNYRKRTRLINKDTVKEFITHLSNKNWNSVSNSNDVNSKFNTFINIFLRNFEANFPTKTAKRISENNEWITKGIKTSCKHKRDLYLNCQSSNNQLMKIHLRKYARYLLKSLKRLNVCITINRY
jgi:hypothetical protein